MDGTVAQAAGLHWQPRQVGTSSTAALHRDHSRPPSPPQLELAAATRFASTANATSLRPFSLASSARCSSNVKRWFAKSDSSEAASSRCGAHAVGYGVQRVSREVWINAIAAAGGEQRKCRMDVDAFRHDDDRTFASRSVAPGRTRQPRSGLLHAHATARALVHCRASPLVSARTASMVESITRAPRDRHGARPPCELRSLQMGLARTRTRDHPQPQRQPHRRRASPPRRERVAPCGRPRARCTAATAAAHAAQAHGWCRCSPSRR